MDDLYKQVNQVLSQFSKDVDQALTKTIKDLAKDTQKKLQEESPEKSGKYAKSWTTKQENPTKFVVYNKEYYLTHLLENGHDIIAGGRKVGHAKGKEHIKPVNEWLQEEAVNRLEDNL